MTPGANDLCVFAVKRGFIENKRQDATGTYSRLINTQEYFYPTRKLGKIVTSYSGGTPSKNNAEYWSGDIPWVSPKDFVHFYIKNSEDHISEDAIASSATRMTPKGSILVVVRSGILKHTLPVAINTVPVTINQDVKVLIPDNSLVPEYLGYFFKVFEKKVLDICVKHSTTVQSVNTNEFFSLDIPMPPVSVQEKLVAYMDTAAENYEERLRTANALLVGMDEYSRDIIGLEAESREKPIIFAAKCSLGSRLDTEYNNPYFTHRVGQIRKVKHDLLGNIISFSSESWDQSGYFDSVFPYIEISGVGLKTNTYEATMTEVKAAPSRAKMIVRNGDIIVSTTRPQRGAVATIHCDEHEIQIASTGFCVLRDILRTDVKKEYLQWILLNDYVLQQMLQRSSGGNYPAIVVEELKKIEIPIPDTDIQEKICAEAIRRKTTASDMINDAERDWANAKAQFEKELLGGAE